MADPITAPVVTDVAAGGTHAPADASAKPGGTPTPAPAPAGGTTAKNWEAEAKSWEAEAKKAFASRDQVKAEARKAFLESDEGRAYVAAQAKLAEHEAAAKAAAEAEAVKRGEFQKLYTEEKSRAEKLQADYEGKLRMQQAQRISDAVTGAYASMGGHDAESFTLLAQRQIADGAVKIDDAGAIVGVAELVAKIKEAKPHLFRANGGASGGGIPGGLGAGSPSIDPKDIRPGATAEQLAAAWAAIRRAALGS